MSKNILIDLSPSKSTLQIQPFIGLNLFEEIILAL
jgi:hypothetical protein